MKTKSLILILGLTVGLMTVSNATILGFGQIGGSNTSIPSDFGSNASADGSGFVVSNGTTLNISLAWDSEWDVHTSSWFDNIEGWTAGGGAWDNEGGVPRVGQLDIGSHEVTFSADSGYALVLNSFDFGQTAETSGITTWEITLEDSGSNVVWSQFLTFNNVNTASTIETVTPNFTGVLGESYTLIFNRTSETYGSNGRHAIDNLSFNQTAVPEPASWAAIAGLAAVGLVLLRRRFCRRF